MAEPAASIDRCRFDAAVLDMDGVVTDTAAVHAAAWKAAFDPFLAARSAAPFDAADDYRRYVDGRVRQDGVRTLLAARGIELPDGDPADPPGHRSVWALANRKNELFLASVTAGGVSAFPSTVELLRQARAAGLRTALVTASRNATDILTAAGVTDLFDVRVDGEDAAVLALPGKPDPATYIEAARRLGVPAARAVVVEDALAGVEAGRRGGFGLVVGVDRTGNPGNTDELRERGADVVVPDLDALRIDMGHHSPRAEAALSWAGDFCGGGRPRTGWVLRYDGYDAAHEGHREALCATGNGRFGSRGAAPESVADGVHYPGTYLAGVYNRLGSEVGGRLVEDESMVNAPNWLSLAFRIGAGEWFAADTADLLDFQQELDLRRGVLSRRLRFRDSAGRVTRVEQRRFVHMGDSRLAALETILTADGWSGPATVRSGVDGRVVNGNVAEYRALASRHLVPLVTESTDEAVLLVCETSGSRIRIGVAARTRVSPHAAATGRADVHDTGYAGQELTLHLTDGVPVTLEKVAAVVTSRDPAAYEPGAAALQAVGRAGSIACLQAAHEAAWERLWGRFHVAADTGDRAALALNLHVFHLLQTLSPHTAQLDAGVPARGLHGEGYRGHVFWDEMFVFPVLNLRMPALTRALLLYRWRRLDEARRAARDAGRAGAMFPWQSGSDGREETPTQFYNVRSGRWMPDDSRLQRHVGIAVAYDVWQYHQVTGDVDFLTGYGAELLVEVARFLADLAAYDPADGRYHIAGVVGPDEFHDRYPGTAEPGLRDNAYTNVMTAWVLCRAREALDLLAGHRCGELWERLGLSTAELDRWDSVSRRLAVPWHDGVISQFDGYGELAEFDWDGYRARYGNIGRLDLILESEGDSPNNYKLSKQADVVMLLYLLSAEELRELLARLGYRMDAATIRRTVEYYQARVSHGSTLSRVVHAWVLARADRERSWPLLAEALDADLADTQGGTTAEGIHLGAMAGTVDLLTRCYAGVETRSGVLWLHPKLPARLSSLRFDLLYRGQWVLAEIERTRLRLSLRPCAAAPIRVAVSGHVHRLTAGETREFPLRDQAPAAERVLRP